MANKPTQFRARRRHKILSKDEWELWLRVMPREDRSIAFSSRILLTPTRGSDQITQTSAKIVVDKLEAAIKQMIFDNDLAYSGIIYINKPDLSGIPNVQSPTDIFKQVSVSIYFSKIEDSDRFFASMHDKLDLEDKDGKIIKGKKTRWKNVSKKAGKDIDVTVLEGANDIVHCYGIQIEM